MANTRLDRDQAEPASPGPAARRRRPAAERTDRAPASVGEAPHGAARPVSSTARYASTSGAAASKPAARPRRSAGRPSPWSAGHRGSGGRPSPRKPARTRRGVGSTATSRAGRGRMATPTSWRRRPAVRRRRPGRGQRRAGVAGPRWRGLVHQPRVAEHDVVRNAGVAVPRRVGDDQAAGGCGMRGAVAHSASS